MRTFIVSDLHGDGNAYKAIMSYLEIINQEEEITLYINGDLIDRGIESAEMLLDIKRRMIEGPFKIEYLGGNHELLMFQTFMDRIKEINFRTEWHDNGGWRTDYGLEDALKTKEKILEVVDFIAELKIYHKFEEKINGQNIVLAHAACPLIVHDECDLRIKDNNSDVEYYTWAREYDPMMPFRCRIGSKDYFSILGHTPNDAMYGCEYHKNDQYINIDGGCAQYVQGLFEFDHIPLVEVKEDYLRILTFNHNNEITHGNYFANGIFIPFSPVELESERSHLDKDFKPKKLVILPDGVVGYEDWIKP